MGLQAPEMEHHEPGPLGPDPDQGHVPHPYDALGRMAGKPGTSNHF